MKIMRRDLKKGGSSIQKSAKSPILNEVTLIQVVRKRVGFQDPKNENIQNFLASKYDIKPH